MLDWEGKIFLLEISEEKFELEDFKKMLWILKDIGIFEGISGFLVGKFMDEIFYDDYKEVLLDIIGSNILIVYNFNVGYVILRVIIFFGVYVYVDVKE